MSESSNGSLGRGPGELERCVSAEGGREPAEARLLVV